VVERNRPSCHWLRRLAVVAAVAVTAFPQSSLAQRETLPDPFAPPASLSLGLPGAAPRTLGETALTLQATHVGRSGRYAVINGHRLRPGERIGNAVVVSIQPASVRLRNPEGEFVLRFSDRGLTKRPAGLRE
jgi:hypothetical protein